MLVFRTAPRDVIDVLDPGVNWKLVPVTHWCSGRDQSKMFVEHIAIDRATNAAEWNARPASLEITWNEISDRKFGDLSRIQTDWSTWCSPEPPGEDWFG